MLPVAGHSLSVAICYEVVYPNLVRQFVIRGSELLTTIMTSFGSLAVPVLALVGTWLILAPVALYFAVTED